MATPAYGNGPENYRTGYYDPTMKAPGTAPMPPESPSLIRDAMKFSEEAVIDLHEAINVIEKRLDTVLAPVPTASVSEQSARLPSSSHLHGRLTSVNEGVAAAIGRLRDLIRRIEI